MLFFSPEDIFYFDFLWIVQIDSTGHAYGPYSDQMASKLIEVDNTLGYLVKQLKEHHLFEKLNLIITSDHGMEQVSKETCVFLDNYVDISLFRAFGSGALFNLFVNDSMCFGCKLFFYS